MQREALRNIGTSLKWSNMSARWEQTNNDIMSHDEEVQQTLNSTTSRRGSAASDNWMLSEEAI